MTRGPAARADGYVIRDITDYGEIRACVAIQERTWGPGFNEIVPAPVLWVATRTGGVVAGAFRDDGALAGFVFGMSGFRDGQPLHWSDMLAVLPEHRGAELGVALKAHQRRVLLQRGIRDVFWTFDPLVSRNAHLNFARLGAISREYMPDLYGATTSPLHAGLATDRLVVHWQLDSPRVRDRMDGGMGTHSQPAGQPAGGPADRPAGAVTVARTAGSGPARPEPAGALTDPESVRVNTGPASPRLDLDGDRLLLRIPADIQTLKAERPAEAEQWQATVRQAFLAYLARGYVAVDLQREGPEYSSYVLVRGRLAEAALSL